MPISLYNFARLHDDAHMREAIRARMEEIIDNGHFIEGPYNLAFEEKFACHQKAKHCLLVGNGTDALEISLKILGIGPGDRVGIPAISFCATAEAVLNTGAQVVLVDVSPETGLMCPNSLGRILRKKHRAKALIPVHLYGLPAPMGAIEETCTDFGGIPLIEDAAQAFGTLIEGDPAGARGHLATFSFYPTKNLGSFGDAGCVLTNDTKLAEQIKICRNHGRGSNGHALGRNSRCDHLQAMILDIKLERADTHNKRRKAIAASYHQRLSGLPLKLVPDKYLPSSSWHLYPVFLKDTKTRETLGEFLKARDIETAPFYLESLGDLPPLMHCEGEQEVARNLAGRILCLPLHPFLTGEEVERVGEAVEEFFVR